MPTRIRIETHFALGALYRRRGEVERAIRIHQNLLAREALAPEHREQALLALAQDYLRARAARPCGRAVPAGERGRRACAPARSTRCAASTSASTSGSRRSIRYRQLARIKAAPPRAGRRPLPVRTGGAGHRARRHRRMRGGCCARRAARRAPFPRAAVLRAQIAEREGRPRARGAAAARGAARRRRKLLQEELPHLLRLVGAERARRAARRNWWRRRSRADSSELKRLVFAAMAAGLAAPRRCAAAIETVFAADPTLHAVWRAARAGAVRAHRAAKSARCSRTPRDIAAASADLPGATSIGIVPACQPGTVLRPYAIVKLR